MTDGVEVSFIDAEDAYAQATADDLVLIPPREFLQIQTKRGLLPAIRLEDPALERRVAEGSITCEHFGICHEFPAGSPWPLSAMMRLNVGTIMVILDDEQMRGMAGDSVPPGGWTERPSASPEWIDWAMRDGFALSFGEVGRPGPYLATGPMTQFPGGIVMMPGDLAQQVALRSKMQPGRNEPCPCGSGLKFKRCHGR